MVNMIAPQASPATTITAACEAANSDNAMAEREYENAARETQQPCHCSHKLLRTNALKSSECGVVLLERECDEEQEGCRAEHRTCDLAGRLTSLEEIEWQ